MIVVVAAAIWLRRKPAARSVAGDRVLAELREGHQALKPALSPSWAAYGALGAALAVAVFGTRSLWTADPEFARALSAAKDKFGPAAQSSGNSSNNSSSCSSSSCGGSSGCGG
jgi:uncharacterized membrane protein YgcG